MKYFFVVVVFSIVMILLVIVGELEIYFKFDKLILLGNFVIGLDG